MGPMPPQYGFALSILYINKLHLSIKNRQFIDVCLILITFAVLKCAYCRLK